MIYSVDFSYGQTLVRARSQEDAEKYMRAEYGRAGEPYLITEASEQDIAWVRAMGGVVHDVGQVPNP